MESERYKVVIRYGHTFELGEFETTMGDLRSGERCIVKSTRGTEMGRVVTSCELLPPMSGKQPPPRVRVIRRATAEDIAKEREIIENQQPEEFHFCKEKIEGLELPMRLTYVEHLLGGEKLIFYFLAKTRVDFRELVKELARAYHTRIEMSQIGARDEAKLVCDVEHCGRELCCRSFMRSLQPVAIRMAKLQKATLDPSKISGACGRLMCCMRFEYEVYNERRKKLPRKGQLVTTPEGKAEVLDYDILRSEVTVELDGGERKVMPASSLQWDAAKSLAVRGEQDDELEGDEIE